VLNSDGHVDESTRHGVRHRTECRVVVGHYETVGTEKWAWFYLYVIIDI
jgi:hypothetical protein